MQSSQMVTGSLCVASGPSCPQKLHVTSEKIVSNAYADQLTYGFDRPNLREHPAHRYDANERTPRLLGGTRLVEEHLEVVGRLYATFLAAGLLGGA